MAVAATLKSESGDPLTDGVVSVRVDAASLQTGIGRRDRKMREEHLEVQHHPAMEFASTSAPRRLFEQEAGMAGPAWVEIEGDLSIHGVTRRVAVRVEATPEEAGWQMKSHFAVRLSDYAIPDPSMAVNKVDDEVDIYFEIKLVDKGQ